MILKKSSEILPVVKENPRGGKGRMITFPFVTQQEAHDTGRLFSKLELPAGASIGMHEHIGEFEIYYVISGTGVVCDGERDYVIEPGDMYLCDDGERHSLTNHGTETLTVIAVIPFVPAKG